MNSSENLTKSWNSHNNKKWSHSLHHYPKHTIQTILLLIRITSHSHHFHTNLNRSIFPPSPSINLNFSFPSQIHTPHKCTSSVILAPVLVHHVGPAIIVYIYAFNILGLPTESQQTDSPNSWVGFQLPALIDSFVGPTHHCIHAPV